MKIVVLIISILIGFIFLLAGLMKLFKSYELNRDRNLESDSSSFVIRVVSLFEILGAILFVIPYSFNFLPFLSTIAAFILTILMIGAPISHIKMGEDKEAAFTAILLILILMVTFFRVFVV